MRLRGKYRLLKPIPKYLPFVVLAWGVAACGGSKKQSSEPYGGDEINIDQLLGIDTENTQPEPTQETSPAEKGKDEDEVLRLLGITTDENKSDETNRLTEQPPSEVQQLKDEMNRLQTELFEKDNIIDELKKELNEKNERLASIQTSGLTTRGQQSLPANGSRALSGSSSRDGYNQALATYNAGRYKQAIEMFSSLLSGNIEASLADNCQYWIGESYYGLRNYAQAIAEFEKVFQYPNSNKADAALLKLGLTYLRLGDKNSARTQFDLLISNHPKSEYINRARDYIAKL
jgi:tol-pal system protein YbgF